MKAVSSGNKEVVQMLIDAGAEVYTANISGQTPLSIANERLRVTKGKVYELYSQISEILVGKIDFRISMTNWSNWENSEEIRARIAAIKAKIKAKREAQE